jgi:DNA mismatch repair protein MutS2
MAPEPLRPDIQTTVFSHAEVTLEFSSVLDLIAAKCVNSGAARAICDLQPTTDPMWIKKSLREIGEVGEYQKLHGRLSVVDTEAASWIELAVDHHEMIPPEGCIAIAGMEREVADLQRRIAEETEFPILRRIVDGMLPHRDLVSTIEAAIDRDGTLKDSASPKLKTLRRNIRSSREDLRKHSENMARSFGSADMATFTGARHVLLVPRDKFRKGEGLIHATSHSGGSLYFEPFSMVEKNNALETLIHDEHVESARILSALTLCIVEAAPGLLENAHVWQVLDILSAKARFSNEFRCNAPVLLSSGGAGDGVGEPAKRSRVVRLVGARHPLLETSLRNESSGRAPVPLDLTMTAESPVMVITGPNAGGKTVTLKTVGLLVLMFQAGLPIPTEEGSELPVFESVYADIGDEQSIASSLSTFTSHLRHLDRMCRSATQDALCLIDEIGDGTDPDEGSALAIATLERLKERGGFVIATTHYGRVKSFALTADNVANASMAFDDATDSPLYRLLQGTAGRSRGLETARRMGFDAPVVKQAESLVGEEAFRLENVLSDLESTLLALEREREALRAQSDTLNRMIASYNEKDKALVEFKDEHREKVRKEIEETLLETRKELEGLVKRIRETQADKTVVRQTHHRIKQLLDKTRRPAKREPEPARNVMRGDFVSISPTGQPRGRVIDLGKKSVTVEINGKKISINKSNLYRVDADAASESGQPERPSFHTPIGVEPMHSTTVDVRGHDREEALEEVDRFLDRAVLSGVQEVTIIHGIGEGVLLQAVQERLRYDPRVLSSRQGLPREGGVGVTVVGLK